MAERYAILDEFLGYQTNDDPSKLDPRYLRSGSKNVLISREKKAGIRAGFTFALETGESDDLCVSGGVWDNSTSQELPWRMDDDGTNGILRVYFGTVDATALNSWYSFATAFNEDYPLRTTTWWDATEGIDVFLMVNHDDNVYEWSGGIAVVGSIPDGTHITKAGTTTWAQNRFYTGGNKTMFCVRTGTEYTYTGGETSTNLTVTDSTGLVAGDILIQKILTVTNEPEADYINDNIFQFNNNVFFSSSEDERVFMSLNTDYGTFTPSSPRVAGEGTTFTLDDPDAKFGVIGKQVVIFAGDQAYLPRFEQIAVGAAVAETVTVEKRSFGSGQGAFSQETIIQVDDAIAFLSKEPTLRLLESPEQIADRDIKALSNPIKPDFDAEDWAGAVGTWHGSRILLHSKVNSKTYILEWVETPDGGVRRFWQPPQILPVGAFASIDGYLNAYSSADGKTLLLFNGVSDYVSGGEKVPIDAVMKLAYNAYGKRGNLKNFNELSVEGEISQNCTDLLVTVEYDFGGATGTVEQEIDGSDQDIIIESIEATSLGQQSLGHQPLGGSTQTPVPASHFQTQLEYARDDFYMLGITFSTNEIDRLWTITHVGPNVQMSRRIRR